MKLTKHSSFILLLLIGLCLFACKETDLPDPRDPNPQDTPKDDPTKEDSVKDNPPEIHSLQLSYEYKFDSFIRYPDGKDTIWTTTGSATDVMEFILLSNDTLEFVRWDSGCDLPICCILPPCPGKQFKLSSDHSYSSIWDHNYDNDLSFSFNADFTEFTANYFWGEPYYSDVYDSDPDSVLYRKLERKYYQFTGVR